MITAIAPSPVTLVAVPKLSIAIYSAIIKATAVSSKPKMDCNTPIAAIIAPPGTPGAATIVMPSMKMKPTIVSIGISKPVIIEIANAQAVIFIALPERWIVAHSGMTNPAIDSSTPFLIVCLSVTGIVAADDWVPNAVK